MRQFHHTSISLSIMEVLPRIFSHRRVDLRMGTEQIVGVMKAESQNGIGDWNEFPRKEIQSLMGKDSRDFPCQRSAPLSLHFKTSWQNIAFSPKLKFSLAISPCKMQPFPRTLAPTDSES